MVYKKTFQRDFLNVLQEGGQHMIYDANGNKIGGLTVTTITDRMNDFPQCTFETYVNLPTSYEEMMDNINKAKAQEAED